MAGKKKADRPYRIHDEALHLDLPHRAYVDLMHAIERAMGLIYRMDIGNTYTVYHEPSSMAIVQITRGVNEFKFYHDNRRIEKWLQSVKQLQENVSVPAALLRRR